MNCQLFAKNFLANIFTIFVVHCNVTYRDSNKNIKGIDIC